MQGWISGLFLLYIMSGCTCCLYRDVRLPTGKFGIYPHKISLGFHNKMVISTFVGCRGAGFAIGSLFIGQRPIEAMSYQREWASQWHLIIVEFRLEQLGRERSLSRIGCAHELARRNTFTSWVLLFPKRIGFAARSFVIPGSTTSSLFVCKYVMVSPRDSTIPLYILHVLSWTHKAATCAQLYVGLSFAQ